MPHIFLSDPIPSRHPLRIHLREDDVLFFLHIPKTAGLSLIDLLDSHFPTNQIFPLHSAPTPELFDAYTLEKMQQYRLVRGHFRFGPYDSGIYMHIAQNPLILTVLRHPIERLVSAYRWILRRPQNRFHHEITTKGITFEQYATDPAYRHLTSNLQSRLVISAMCPDPGVLSDVAKAHLARQRLEQFAFVGITERFSESMEVLSHVFGWPPPAEMPHVNASPRPTSRDDISPNLLETLIEQNAADLALYEFAVKLLDARLVQMRQERMEMRT
jgi:hypothetical protein